MATIETELRDCFFEIAPRMADYYECHKDVDPLTLELRDGPEDSARADLFSRCESGKLIVSAAGVERLDDEVSVLDTNLEPAQVRRLYVGVGIANVIAASQLERHASSLKSSRYSESLREVFASHTPVDNLFKKIFYEQSLKDRANMTSGMTDASAIGINGLRYSLRLLTDVFAESGDHAIVPSRSKLKDCARRSIFNRYMNQADIYNDIMVVGLNQPASAGDKVFFGSLQDWLIAAAQPFSDAEMSVVHSGAWQHD